MNLLIKINDDDDDQTSPMNNRLCFMNYLMKCCVNFIVNCKAPCNLF